MEFCREYGISTTTHYNWKLKYRGITALDVKKLKALEDVIRRLKRMYTDMSLQHEALKDIVEKALNPTKKIQLVDCSRQKHGLSIRSAYEAIGISRTVSLSARH
jgi:putative transposase